MTFKTSAAPRALLLALPLAGALPCPAADERHPFDISAAINPRPPFVGFSARV